MLAEVRRSDFLPIRSFAEHCRSYVGLYFPTNAEFWTAEAPSSGSISDSVENSVLVAPALLPGLEIAGGGSFEQGAVGGESRAV
jgi:hypothetical protein